MSAPLALLCLLAALLLPASRAASTPRSVPDAVPGEVPNAVPNAVPSTRDAQRVDLSGAIWTNDSRPAPPPAVSGAGAAALVTLPQRARGERWAMVFETDAAGTARLLLEHRGGPDGLLYEVVLDGQRLTPARDAWRPTQRDVRVDLGPQWLGPGSHLLEFVAREQPAWTAALSLRSLELSWR
jgi:hypothetical protein